MQCYCVLMYLMFWKSFLSKRKSWLPYLATSAPVSGLIPINYLLNFRSPSTRSDIKASLSGALRKHFLLGVDLLRHWNIIIQMRIVTNTNSFFWAIWCLLNANFLFFLDRDMSLMKLTIRPLSRTFSIQLKINLISNKK